MTGATRIHWAALLDHKDNRSEDRCCNGAWRVQSPVPQGSTGLASSATRDAWSDDRCRDEMLGCSPCPTGSDGLKTSATSVPEEGAAKTGATAGPDGFNDLSYNEA